MAIRAILFDLDNTLLLEDEATERALEQTGELAGRRTGRAPEAIIAAARDAADGLFGASPTFAYADAMGIWFSGRPRHASFQSRRETAPCSRLTPTDWSASRRAAYVVVNRSRGSPGRWRPRSMNRSNEIPTWLRYGPSKSHTRPGSK